MEAYVQGVSTRSVDDLVKALGGDTGISKSEVSRICGDLDTELSVSRTRPLDHTRFPYIYLDATYCKARVNHQIVSQAVVVATGITEDGGREVLGLMVGDSETEVFWSEFLRSLRERGLTGVRLVIADHHSGLVKAVRKVMLGAAYQRCRVHWTRTRTRCCFLSPVSLTWYGDQGRGAGSTRRSVRGVAAPPERAAASTRAGD